MIIVLARSEEWNHLEEDISPFLKARVKATFKLLLLLSFFVSKNIFKNSNCCFLERIWKRVQIKNECHNYSWLQMSIRICFWNSIYSHICVYVFNKSIRLPWSQKRYNLKLNVVFQRLGNTVLDLNEGRGYMGFPERVQVRLG